MRAISGASPRQTQCTDNLRPLSSDSSHGGKCVELCSVASVPSLGCHFIITPSPSLSALPGAQPIASHFIFVLGVMNDEIWPRRVESHRKIQYILRMSEFLSTLSWFVISVLIYIYCSWKCKIEQIIQCKKLTHKSSIDTLHLYKVPHKNLNV